MLLPILALAYLIYAIISGISQKKPAYNIRHTQKIIYQDEDLKIVDDIILDSTVNDKTIFDIGEIDL